MEDFIALALRSKSTQFYGNKISFGVFTSYLEQLVYLGVDLDRIKKALFYGSEPHIFSACGEGEESVPDDIVPPDVIHGVLGVITEAAEMADALLQALRKTVELDQHNLHEESGDIKWYLALLAESRGEKWDDDEKTVIAKLMERYPEKFNKESAEIRDLEAERKIIESRNNT